MISFIPYFREARGAIVIKVNLNRETAKVVNPGIKINPAQWDEKNRKIVKHPNANLLNQKIQGRISELQKEILKAELLGVPITRERVKKICEGAAITTDCLKWAEQFIKDKYTNKGTAAAQTTELNKLKSFAPTLQFGDIDARFLEKYHKWLKQHYKGNTPWKALKFVRTLLYAAGPGIVAHNPFEHKEFKMPAYVQPVKDGLTIEELDRLEKILVGDYPVMHKIVTAKFLFMCYTGLRISDAKTFSLEEHLHHGERVIITSKKTGVTTNLKLYKRLAELLQKMHTLPVKQISDQKLNGWLKEIAKAAGIARIELTSHVGRHSFGCLLAEMGVSEEEAMKLMGHKRKENTRIYFQLRQPQIDKAADKLNNF